jgi:thiol-disulfide isomerase/thioredoxin
MNERMEITKRSASLGISVLIVLSAWATGGTAEQRSIRLSENRSIEQIPTDLDAETVLQRAAAQYDKLPSLLHDSETIVTWPEREFKPGDRTELRYVCRFIQDQERIDWSKELFETVDEKEELFRNSREIWDGSKFLFRTKLPDMDMHNAYFTKNKSTINTLMQVDRKDSFLDGILGQIGSGHYTQDLLDSEQMTLHKQMEEIDGHACYVIEAILRKGPIGKFWIDPAAGYNLRKVVAHYELVGDPPEPPPGVIVVKNTATFEYVIDNVVLEQIGDIWFPVAGICDFKETYTDGSSHHSKFEARRTNVVWNPDLDALGAFKMDLPEGARISNQDDESNVYVWRNGKPEKVNHIHAEMVGRQAPPLEVEKWYNSQAGGLDRKGKVILLDFFGVWCRPCMAKIPFIKELHKQYSDRGLIVIGVHTAQSSEKIPEFISRDDIKYTIAVDEHGINAKSFNVFFYPTVVLIDRKGVIKAVNPSEMELKDLLTSLLEQ